MEETLPPVQCTGGNVVNMSDRMRRMYCIVLYCMVSIHLYSAS